MSKAAMDADRPESAAYGYAKSARAIRLGVLITRFLPAGHDALLRAVNAQGVQVQRKPQGGEA